MHRRDFHHVGTDMLLAMAATDTTMAQTSAPTAVKKLNVYAYSRHLQWLRTADELAEATIEMGFDGADLTVRPIRHGLQVAITRAMYHTYSGSAGPYVAGVSAKDSLMEQNLDVRGGGPFTPGIAAAAAAAGGGRGRGGPGD